MNRRFIAALLLICFTASTVGVRTQVQQTVFVHGLASSGSTWDEVAARMTQQFQIQAHKPDLLWRDHFGSQANYLQSTYLSGVQHPIAIGHSNGGIVSREWSKLRDLDAVVTVGTPHRGAPLVVNADWFGSVMYTLIDTIFAAEFNTRQLAIRDLGNPPGEGPDWWSLLDYFLNGVSWLTPLLDYGYWGVLTTLGIQGFFPVFGEMEPASQFIHDLNDPSNLNREASAIPIRISVVSSAPKSGGVFRATLPDSADWMAWVIWVAAGITAYNAVLVYADAAPEDWEAMLVAAQYTSIASQLLALDWEWCAAVTTEGAVFCDDNDSVVPVWSQHFPNSNFPPLMYATNGPVHIRETRESDLKIREALLNYIHVPPVGPPPNPPLTQTVSLQASSGHFVVAESGGGEYVYANRTSAGVWEIFTLIDLNGGELRDGDPVAFRVANGMYLQAVNGGGGDAMAAGLDVLSWETFTLVDLDRPGGVVASGDAIAIQSLSGHFMSADGGGGSWVSFTASGVGGWEVFRIFNQ